MTVQQTVGSALADDIDSALTSDGPREVMIDPVRAAVLLQLFDVWEANGETLPKDVQTLREACRVEASRLTT